MTDEVERAVPSALENVVIKVVARDIFYSRADKQPRDDKSKKCKIGLYMITVRNNRNSAIVSLNGQLFGRNLDRVAIFVGEGCIDTQCRLRGVVRFKIVLCDQGIKPGRR
jgi:hypothetical protein